MNTATAEVPVRAGQTWLQHDPRLAVGRIVRVTSIEPADEVGGATAFCTVLSAMGAGGAALDAGDTVRIPLEEFGDPVLMKFVSADPAWPASSLAANGR